MTSAFPTLRLITLTVCMAVVTSAAGHRVQAQGAVPTPPDAVPAPPSAADPPSVAGRVAYLDGAVSFRPAADETWALAEPNRAVSTGDRLWVDSVGRAEVEFGANAFRLSRETEVDIVHLDDNGLQLRVPQGMMMLRLKTIGAGGIYEIDAPNAAVGIGEEGEYRVDVSPDGLTTSVTVWSGQARVTAAGSTFDVSTGQLATVRGDSAPTYDVADAPAPDDFRQWCVSRDQHQDQATVSTRYVSADMGGVEDLDAYGGWQTDPDNGPVWYPTTVAVGWSPYQFGHWVWEGPWGWVWVADEPWGWAPYHYGRWAYVGARWGWYPGGGIYRPVFAPALVGFVGGPGWGVSIGFGAAGGVGWFPLGPREPYFPSYATDIGYRERINVTNYRNVAEITNVTNINYRNRTVAGAVVAESHDAFVNGQSVQRAAVRLSPAALTSAHMLGAGPGVVPTAASLAPMRGVGGRPAAAPPRGLESRPVVAEHAPPPAPVPFSAQRDQLAANGGRPLTRQQLSAIRTTQPAAGRAAAFPVRSAAVAPTGHTLSPARSGIPAAAPALTRTGVPARAVGVPTVPSRATGTNSLDSEFESQRAAMEARHTQEFAHPPAGETQAQLSARQENEHTQLRQTYQNARVNGAAHMPPASHESAPRASEGRPR